MKLKEFFSENPEVAIAFSGGVDSAYLLHEACKYAKKVRAYYVNTAFQPEFELKDALRLVSDIKHKEVLTVLEADILSCEAVTRNPADRCYHCKKQIFGTIIKAAENDGFKILLDGTNASDEEGDRPGMKALRELSVMSPLRLCGLTKQEIRALSKEEGLFTYNKPAYACLATRIPTGEIITAEKLSATEASENFLFSLGFTDFRVRTAGNFAKIQVPSDQCVKIIENREIILKELSNYYSSVTLDLKTR